MSRINGMGKIVSIFTIIFCILGFSIYLLPTAAEAQTGAISGQVTDGSVGIASVDVSVYDCNCNYLDDTYTDANGDYTVTGLPSGSYKVEFYAYDRGYANKYYSDKTGCNGADPVTVTAPGTTTGIDVVLEFPGSVSGRVTDGSVGIGYVNVYVFDSNYNNLGGGSTDANGDYTVTGLPSGSHKVKFKADSDTGYAIEWYNDKADFSSADPVTVAASGTTMGIDAVLEPGGGISGRVTDGSVGIANVIVIVYDGNRNYIGYGETDTNGEYSVTGLPSGSHKVRFQRYDYLSEWYNDKVGFVSADPVTVTAPDTTTDIDAVLLGGEEGGISGHVTDGIGSVGIAGVEIYVYDSNHNLLSDDLTDARGDYTVTGLPSGSHKVEFSAYGTGYIDEWYNDKADFSSADPVTVTVPNNTPNINALLQNISNELAVDFGTSGLWHYDGSWNKMTNWNPDDDLAGWSGGLGVDFGTNGLWNYDGSSWSRLTTWDAGSGGLVGWSGGLAVDFDGSGLWNNDGTTWSRISNWDPDDDMAGWSGGLAVDFGTNGLWNNDGSSWGKLSNWNVDSAGMAGWDNGLAVDFDSNGLWNNDGSSWSRMSNWDPENDLAGWPGGLAVDFGANGLWNNDGSSWTRISNWNPEGMTGVADGLVVDFDGSGVWKYDGSSWSKMSNWNAENMDDCDLN